MKVEQYTCDNCGVVKGETNHWWWIISQSGSRFSVHPWATDVKLANGESEVHLCGEQCVTHHAGTFSNVAKSSCAHRI